MAELTTAAFLSLSCLALLAATRRLRFLSEECPSVPRRAIALLLLFAIFTACIFHPTVSAGSATDLDPSRMWFAELFAGHALFTLFLYAWWRLSAPRRLDDFLFLARPRLGDVRVGLWVGGVAWLTTIVIMAVVGSLAMGATGPAETPSLPPIIPWLADLVLWRKLVVIAIAMTVEEAFFRAYLQTRIGWVPSSVLFALGHGSYGLPLLMVSVLIVSLVIGWSFRRNGRLLPCIVAHGTFDAIQLLVVLPWAVRQMQAGSG